MLNELGIEIDAGWIFRLGQIALIVPTAGCFPDPFDLGCRQRPHRVRMRRVLLLDAWWIAVYFVLLIVQLVARDLNQELADIAIWIELTVWKRRSDIAERAHGKRLERIT